MRVAKSASRRAGVRNGLRRAEHIPTLAASISHVLITVRPISDSEALFDWPPSRFRASLSASSADPERRWQRDQSRSLLVWGKSERTMPITPFVQDQAFDPEALRVMGIAFERACQSLGLADKCDAMTKLVACEIIDAANKGERDPDRLFGVAMEWSAPSPEDQHKAKKAPTAEAAGDRRCAWVRSG